MSAIGKGSNCMMGMDAAADDNVFYGICASWVLNAFIVDRGIPSMYQNQAWVELYQLSIHHFTLL